MIDLIGQVLRVQQQTGDKPIVIHCRFVSLHCVYTHISMHALCIIIIQMCIVLLCIAI